MATAPAAAATSSSYSEGFFSSPTDLANAAIQANLAVSNIDRAIAAAAGGTSAAPEAWSESWDAFKLTWQSFYKQNFSSGDGAAWLTSDLEGSLESYQKQISNFAAQAQSYGISIPGSVPNVPTDDPFSWLPTGGTVLGALGLIALILIVWKVA